MTGGPEPEPEGGDPACWADQFEELLFGDPAEPDDPAEPEGQADDEVAGEVGGDEGGAATR